MGKKSKARKPSAAQRKQRKTGKGTPHEQHKDPGGPRPKATGNQELVPEAGSAPQQSTENNPPPQLCVEEQPRSASPILESTPPSSHDIENMEDMEAAAPVPVQSISFVEMPPPYNENNGVTKHFFAYGKQRIAWLEHSVQSFIRKIQEWIWNNLVTPVLSAMPSTRVVFLSRQQQEAFVLSRQIQAWVADIQKHLANELKLRIKSVCQQLHGHRRKAESDDFLVNVDYIRSVNYLESERTSLILALDYVQSVMIQFQMIQQDLLDQQGPKRSPESDLVVQIIVEDAERRLQQLLMEQSQKTNVDHDDRLSIATETSTTVGSTVVTEEGSAIHDDEAPNDAPFVDAGHHGDPKISVGGQHKNCVGGGDSHTTMASIQHVATKIHSILETNQKGCDAFNPHAEAAWV